MDVKSTLYRCNMIFRPNPVGFFDQVTENRKCTGAAQANIGLPRISYLDLLPFLPLVMLLRFYDCKV